MYLYFPDTPQALHNFPEECRYYCILQVTITVMIRCYPSVEVIVQ